MSLNRIDFGVIFIGGVFFNILCGALIGGVIWFILRDRIRVRSTVLIITLICAFLFGVALAITWRVAGTGVLGVPAGLIVYPFINKATAWHPIPFAMAAVLDVALMMLSGTVVWKLILRQKMKQNANNEL